MAKKLFLNRERNFPVAQAPSVIGEEREAEITSSNRNSPLSEITEQLPFKILDQTRKSFPKFNANGRSLLIKFNHLITSNDSEKPIDCLFHRTNGHNDDDSTVFFRQNTHY